MTADHAGQTGGERECLCGHTHGLHVAPSGRTTRCWVIACRCSGYAPSATPSRPVPVPGQAAREAAASLIAGYVILGRIEPFNLAVLPKTDRDGYLALADRVAALSAAGGQVCGGYEPEPGTATGDDADVHSAAGGQET